MAKIKGNDIRLYIESATPATFNVIKGETGHTVNRQASQIDTTSKDDGAYGTSMPGSRALSISLTVIPDLPDATGLERLLTVANATPQVATKFQRRKSPYAIGDVIMEGEFFVADIGDAANQNQPHEATITLVAAKAPSQDDLT